MVDLGGGTVDPRLPLDGASLLPYLQGERQSKDAPHTVYGEYAGEGTIAPLMMIRRGHWKFVFCPADPPQLFDLADDPKELINLAESPSMAVKAVLDGFLRDAHERWDFDRIHHDVLCSQRSRRICWDALTRGRFESWDYQPSESARERYVLDVYSKSVVPG